MGVRFGLDVPLSSRSLRPTRGPGRRRAAPVSTALPAPPGQRPLSLGRPVGAPAGWTAARAHHIAAVVLARAPGGSASGAGLCGATRLWSERGTALGLRARRIRFDVGATSRGIAAGGSSRARARADRGAPRARQSHPASKRHPPAYPGRTRGFPGRGFGSPRRLLPQRSTDFARARGGPPPTLYFDRSLYKSVQVAIWQGRKPHPLLMLKRTNPWPSHSRRLALGYTQSRIKILRRCLLL